MKRRIILSIALVLSIAILSLASFTSTEAENQTKYVFDTGLVTPGPGQEVRVSVLSGTPTANGTFNFRLRQISYAQESCDGGICRQTIAEQTVSDLVTLMPNEAASIDFRRCTYPLCGGIRGVLLTDSKDAKVNVMIIDTATGRIVVLEASDGSGIPML